MTNLKSIFVALALITLASAAQAVQLRNLDTAERVVTITENGVRSDQVLKPGAEIDVCASGCFLTIESGDMLPLTGSEIVVIEVGRARILAQ